MKYEFKSINGAEIFAAGEWNGLTFSEKDLDGIVASFNAMNLTGRVPLKFGHNGADARDGAPALGWVNRIYREGSKLFADMSSLPDVVYEAIKQGMYKFVSVELLKDVPANTRNIPWVLDAVALLGADQPAVGILKDLQALTMSRGTGLQGKSRAMFKREFNHKETAMSEDIKVMQEQLKALMSRVDVSDARAKEAEKALELQVESQRKEKISIKRNEINLMFERAIAAHEIIPAVREAFSKVYRVDDDSFVERISIDDAKSFIKANATNKSKEATLMSRQTTDDLNGSNSEVVHELASREAVARGFTANNVAAVSEATKAVFKRNPQLAAAYFNAPNGAYKSEV